MNVAALLDETRRAGIGLTVRGDRLHVEAKPGTVTADLRDRLTAAKPDLVALLGARERMDKGLTPMEWGEPVARTCEACGPVLLWATCPATVKACPWCFRRVAGKPIARPKGER